MLFSLGGDVRWLVKASTRWEEKSAAHAFILAYRIEKFRSIEMHVVLMTRRGSPPVGAGNDGLTGECT